MNKSVTVYGTTWCAPCSVAKQKLEHYGIEFTFVDIDKDAVAKTYVKANSKTIPYVEFRTNGDITLRGGNEAVDMYMAGL